MPRKLEVPPRDPLAELPVTVFQLLMKKYKLPTPPCHQRHTFISKLSLSWRKFLCYYKYDFIRISLPENCPWEVVFSTFFLDKTAEIEQLYNYNKTPLTVEDIFCSFIIILIFVTPCLHKQFGYRRMDIRVFGRSFNYVVVPEIYYTQLLVWFSISRFVEAFHRSVLARVGSYSLYSKHLTRSGFWSQQGASRTQILRIM